MEKQKVSRPILAWWIMWPERSVHRGLEQIEERLCPEAGVGQLLILAAEMSRRGLKSSITYC